ncbi:hypothetical protein FB45DRAFT_902275 [Roridomyces roridus]|uniref:Uncharacterized protein n=1 Tax=Roridomyces roridus TaxID=1738132 RepID=A0AAD7C3H5_9AGAR|nr:hypothetical protein FB45DRAFT_902275 [Roridomyces roridus]
MSAEQLLAKCDLDKFKWSSTDARTFSRPLGGSELVQDLYNRFEKGNQALFFAAYLDFAEPQAVSTVLAAARAAWLSLRYQIPIVATSIQVDDSSTPRLEYRVGDAAQVNKWADRTLVVNCRPVLDLNRFREELGAQMVPSVSGDQTWMHIVMTPASLSSSRVSQLGFILHTHHAPIDGMGSRIVVNRYLTEFAKSLGDDGKEPALQWGGEVENLTPAVFNVLAPSEPVPIPSSSAEEPSVIHPLYATLLGEMAVLGKSLEDQHGFKPRGGDPGWPNAQRLQLLFSSSESDRVFECMKEQPYTLTILAHAALAMTQVFFNPVSTETEHLYMNNFVMRDIRSRLKAPYTDAGYPGYALSPPMFRLPVSLFLSDGTLLPMDRELLLKLMGETEQIYDGHRKMAVAYVAQAAEVFAYMMQQGYAHNQVAVNEAYNFSSDGAGEKYLDSTFQDANGKNMFSLRKFFTSVNHPHPAPYFRLSSWKRIIDIGADFNGNLLAPEEANEYLAKWKEFMLLIVN